RSIFVKTGGQLTKEQESNPMMRRISSMHNNNIEQARLIAEARRKVEMRKQSLAFCMPLPNITAGLNSPTVQKLITKGNKQWDNISKNNLGMIPDNSEIVDLPDDVPLVAPPDRSRDDKSTKNVNTN